MTESKWNLPFIAMLFFSLFIAAPIGLLPFIWFSRKSCKDMRSMHEFMHKHTAIPAGGTSIGWCACGELMQTDDCIVKETWVAYKPKRYPLGALVLYGCCCIAWVIGPIFKWIDNQMPKIRRWITWTKNFIISIIT